MAKNQLSEYQAKSGRMIKENGLVINVADGVDAFNKSVDAFRNVVVTIPDITIDLVSSDGASVLRSDATTTGGGTYESTESEHKLSVSGGNASVDFRTKERGQYVPGSSSIVGIGIRMPQAPTGDTIVKWGYFDGTGDGFCWGMDAGGFFVGVVNGLEFVEKVYQEDWNGDKMDGTGESGITLTPSDGTIFQISFTWYGYGEIEFRVSDVVSYMNRQAVATAHRIRLRGQTSIDRPNKPVSIYVEQTDTTDLFEVYVGGRQYATLTDAANRTRRELGQYRLNHASVGQTFVPAITIRRNPNEERWKGINILPTTYGILSNQNLLIQVRLNATVTGGTGFRTPDDVDASETAVQIRNDATAITGGHLLNESLASGSQQNTSLSALEGSRFALGDNDIITLCYRTIGTQTATVSTVWRWIEAW